MRTRLWILVLSGMGVGSPAWADDSVARAHQAVLDRAVILAGLQFTRPPLVLTSTLPWTASAGAEAWTTCDADDHGDRIFVYTRSALFQCANQGDWQCMLKLASVLVHEAWHFRNGRDEAGAYTAQITFLMHQGSDATAAGVRRARDRVLAVRGSPVEAVAIKLRERQTSPLP